MRGTRKALLRFPSTVTLATVTLVLAALAGHGTARAEGFKMLHAFKGGSGDGDGPRAGVIADRAGNLYGETSGGGAFGAGTVFKLTPDGVETILYNFTGGVGGNYPSGGLIVDKQGNFRGTTQYGGAASCNGGRGCGTVFKLSPSGAFSTSYTFLGGNDGAYPEGLIADGKGNLFGTALAGGNAAAGCIEGCGTVFEISAGGSFEVLYAFKGGSDGALPTSGLMLRKGSLYGTTEGGGGVCSGIGCGTVFKIAADATETVLYAFLGGSDGSLPNGALIADKAGNIYGTTTYGGGTACNGGAGCGTVFKLAPNGDETRLHLFTGGEDGNLPSHGVIADADGNLFGTTYYGGGSRCQGFGCGTVFKIAPDGTETVAFAFVQRVGANPNGSLLAKGAVIFGTAEYGGTGCGGVGCGTVFKLKR